MSKSYVERNTASLLAMSLLSQLELSIASAIPMTT
jgi:hypothetical protein